MKKLYLGSIALIVFSLSAITFQLSCSEDAISQNAIDYILPPATKTTLGGVIVGSGLAVESNGTLSVTPLTTGLVQKNLILYVKNTSKVNNTNEYWIANIDGTNQHKVNITLPANLNLTDEAQLSPDGTKIIFSVEDTSNDLDHIYSVSVEGGNPTKIINGSVDSRMYIKGVH